MLYFSVGSERHWLSRWLSSIAGWPVTDERGEFLVTGFKVTVRHDIAFGYLGSDIFEIVQDRSFFQRWFFDRLYRDPQTKKIDRRQLTRG